MQSNFPIFFVLRWRWHWVSDVCACMHMLSISKFKFIDRGAFSSQRKQTSRIIILFHVFLALYTIQLGRTYFPNSQIFSSISYHWMRSMRSMVLIVKHYANTQRTLDPYCGKVNISSVGCSHNMRTTYIICYNMLFYCKMCAIVIQPRQ